MHPTIRARRAEAGAGQSRERRPLRGKVARSVARGRGRIRQPEFFCSSRRKEALIVCGRRSLLTSAATGRKNARPVDALEQRTESRQTALEFEEKSRRLRFESKILRFEVRFHVSARRQLRPVLAEKGRHSRPGNPHGRLQHAAQGGRKTQRLKPRALPDPLLAEHRRNGEPSAQAQDDFTICFQRCVQRREQGRCGNLNRGASSQRDARMACEQREHRDELLCFEQ